MKEFENALTAAFGARPAEVPELAIDHLDGRAAGPGAAPLCYTWAAEPVRASTCVTRVETGPASGYGGTCYCRVETGPARGYGGTCYCRAETGSARGYGGTCYCRAEPAMATVCRAEPVAAAAG
ncbi:hypothetical protein [Amycolatopsis sp. CA-128772]|uniref:hypothetical protein n=1 Tax=Amycolatopsis sp. CA-128772 TaxID=2073159 RepID=UPI000CD0A743|nr:hypothetical protein [Amycolatopsis sp. CA-128772]